VRDRAGRKISPICFSSLDDVKANILSLTSRRSRIDHGSRILSLVAGITLGLERDEAAIPRSRASAEEPGEEIALNVRGGGVDIASDGKASCCKHCI